MQRFDDLKNGFTQILSDRYWLPKILLGGCLLINPLLVALAPFYFEGISSPEKAVPWVHTLFPWIIGFNALTFWFPLGFTFEVLRRARYGHQRQLPSWKWSLLPRYATEGGVKLILAVPTLIVPVLLWISFCKCFFIDFLKLPLALMGLFVPPVMLFVIPFCGVACCRWLDGDSVLDCAFNYRENMRLFRKGKPDYLLASTFLIGINAITTAFFYTIPFAAVFGLCIVDTWFGPIFAEHAETKKIRSFSHRPKGEAVTNGKH